MVTVKTHHHPPSVNPNYPGVVWITIRIINVPDRDEWDLPGDIVPSTTTFQHIVDYSVEMADIEPFTLTLNGVPVHMASSLAQYGFGPGTTHILSWAP